MILPNNTYGHANNYYQKHSASTNMPKPPKNENTKSYSSHSPKDGTNQNVASSPPPLTDREARLAWEWNKWSQWNSMLMHIFRGNATEEERQEMAEFRLRHRLGTDQFSLLGEFKEDNGMINPFGGQHRIDPAAVSFVEIRKFPVSNQSFRMDRASNSLTIGIGSRVAISGIPFRMEVGERMILWDSGNRSLTRQEQDLMNQHSMALRNLLHSLNNPDGIRIASDSPMHRAGDGNDVLALLQGMGIDTSRPFTINGMRFFPRNGAIYSENFVQPSPPPAVPTWEEHMVNNERGKAFLNDLVRRAYEQNLF